MGTRNAPGTEVALVNSTKLREVIRHPGPFASVYLDFSHDTEDAARQLRLKGESARAELAEAPPAAAIAVGATVVIAPVGMELADGVGVRPRHGPG
jgi:hypothetical protein